MKSPSPARLWRLHEALAVFPIFWAMFHVWEQWAGFGGRDAFLERSIQTSHSTVAITLELVLAILPAVLWVVLEIHLRMNYGEPSSLCGAMAEDEEVARRIGLLVRVSSWVFFAWLLYHTAWLYAPKLDGSEPTVTWLTLRNGMGTWIHAALHAVGLTAFFVHFWASAPRLLIAFEWVGDVEGRRAARLSGFIVAVLFFVLFAQLAGWHASGAGTIWSL